MSKLDYQCTFNLQDCIRELGLDEKGRVQKVVTEETLTQCDTYVPFAEGTLLSSGTTEGTDVVWGGEASEYAHYMWEGIVYEDPERHCAGSKAKDGGWESRKNVKKVPTNRPLQYQGESTRGDHWVIRMMQNGGREKIEEAARKEAGK